MFSLLERPSTCKWAVNREKYCENSFDVLVEDIAHYSMDFIIHLLLYIDGSWYVLLLDLLDTRN